MADPFARHGSAQLLPFRRRTRHVHVGQRRYDRLMADVAAVDAELADLVARRRELAHELTDLADACWPLLARLQGYRAPSADELPMPDASEDAEGIIGGRLRSVVMTLLVRYGACPLRTIHCLLLTHGFVVRSARPVKALADALNVEVHRGRAVRVARGVYAASPARKPRSGRSGAVALIPGSPWIATQGADHRDDLPSPLAWN